jgi:hypothetical protein
MITPLLLDGPQMKSKISQQQIIKETHVLSAERER